MTALAALVVATLPIALVRSWSAPPVTATGVDKVYDGTTDATYSSASFEDKHVGMDKTVNVSISGSDADNHTLGAMAVFIGTGGLTGFAGASGESPWIASDKDDYAPGELVTLTGGNWQPGESVRIVVDDEVGRTWQRDVTVIAAGDGTIVDSFNLPSRFVAAYTVVGTGDVSWTATTSFTDGAVRVRADGTGETSAPIDWVHYDNTTCNGAVLGSGSFNAGTTENGTDIGFAVSDTQSLLLTAGPVSGLASSGWSNGNFSDTSANPTCLAGTTSTQNTRISYVAVTSRATTTTLALTTGSDPSTYGDALTFTATVTATGGNPNGVGTVTFQDGDAILCDSVSLTGNTAPCSLELAAGPHSVTAEFSGGTSGSVQFGASVSAPLSHTVDAKNLTIDGAVAQDKVYDGTTDASVDFSGVSLVGVVGSGDLVIDASGASASFADKHVGDDKPVKVTGVGLAGADAGNYTVSQPSGLTANITPRDLTVTATGVDKVYDGTTDATIASRSLSGDQPGDDVTLIGGTASFEDKNVGVAKTVTGTGFALGGADAGNYSLASTTLTTTADITPRDLTVTATADDKVYDGTTDATVTVNHDALAGDDVTAAHTSAAFDDKNVGTEKTVTVSGISISGADAGNYALTSDTATTTADISTLGITGSFTAADKVYDGTTDAVVLTRSLSGTLMGDDVSLSGGTARFSDKDVGTGKTVTLTGALLAGDDAGNYTLLSVDDTMADITPRDLTVTATGVDKVYDGTTDADVVLSTDKVAGDDLEAADSSASFEDKHVGMDKTVNVSGISISGSDADNYTLLNTTARTTADITARPITVTAVTDTKVYDGTTASSGEPVITFGGLAPGDTATWTQTFVDKNVGTGKTLTPAGVVDDGNGGANYTVTLEPVHDGEITTLGITGSFTAADKVYDGTTDAVVLTRSLSGTLMGDDVSLSGGTARFSDKDVGTGKTVTLTGALLAGDDAGNYTLLSVDDTMADITPRDLTTEPAAPLFADGFESGDLNAWERTTGLTVQDEEVFAGAYAARSVDSPAWALHRLPQARSEITLRVQTRLIGHEAGVTLARLRPASGPSLLQLYVTSRGKLAYKSNVGPIKNVSDQSLSTGRWYQLEVRARVDGEGGHVDVLLDGAPVRELSRTEDLGTFPVQELEIGDRTVREYGLVFDEVVVESGVPSVPVDLPMNLRTTTLSSTQVGLAWDPPLEGTPSSYEVFRDNVSVGTTVDPSFEDVDVLDRTRYVYSVVAITEGTRSDASASLLVTMPGFEPSDAVVYAAGDIACDSHTASETECHHGATSHILVQAEPDGVLILGDAQYPDGAIEEFATYFQPTWGRVKHLLHPAPGNHEYHTPGAAGYYEYFGDAAHGALGYYSFEVGSWHVISLNSNCEAIGGCRTGSPQYEWLVADLQAHADTRCTLAFWHHPPWSSGRHGSSSRGAHLWDALYAEGADLVLTGHDHLYERFAPQDADGGLDPALGIRSFVVGTGGKSLYDFGTPLPNSEVRDNTTFGVLKLSLHEESYDWQFVPEQGGTFTDPGSSSCH